MQIKFWFILFLVVQAQYQQSHAQAGDYDENDDQEKGGKIEINRVKSVRKKWVGPGTMTLHIEGGFPHGFTKSNTEIATRTSISRLEFYYATGKAACEHDQMLPLVRDEALKSKNTNGVGSQVRYTLYTCTNSKHTLYTYMYMC